MQLSITASQQRDLDVTACYKKRRTLFQNLWPFTKPVLLIQTGVYSQLLITCIGQAHFHPAESNSFTATIHTLDLLWEKFQWILPLYMKPISFQSKASFVCSVTTAIFIDFCLNKLNVFSQHIGQKTKWISEFPRTNPQELKCWSTFCVNYFLRYYLMMQHQPIVKE